MPPLERWHGLTARARRNGQLVAVDEMAYPAHFAVFARYGSAPRRLPRHHPLPPSLALEPTLAALADAPWVRLEPLGR